MTAISSPPRTYECPTCRRHYVSPIRLAAAPICTGNGRRHQAREMRSER